ncbi:MAG: PQQ-dependent sugar dehydrogenase [Anaerolineae bacterium]|nr:PQQ-dependent sugar dehydrogenase [Anaerolineae bacterium]
MNRNFLRLAVVGIGVAVLILAAPISAQTPTPDPEVIQQGQTLYQATCASCHGLNTGEVTGNVIIGKDLVNNVFVQSLSDEELLAFIQQGRPVEDPLNTTKILMPPRGGNPNLTDADLMLIIAYLRTLSDPDASRLVASEVEDTGTGTGSYQWVQVVDNLDNPLQLVNAGDGSGRLFVAEQTGYILVIENGEFHQTPFLDISTLIPDSVYHGGYTEQGLLGLAFHPDYENNGQFFISYTNDTGDSVIARYQVSTDDPNVADPNSAQILLTLDQPFPDHNGGNILFGPDGYLYIAFGDGGNPYEPNYNSQNPTTFLGKMLRIDVNAETYRVPEDNPFVNDPNFPPEVWAYGLRNPWRFSFDRVTGDLYIADVGQWLIEEVNFQPAGSPGGQNYGWSAYEGTQRYLMDVQVTSEVTLPVLQYTHDMGCSITGGPVYRGKNLPNLQGRYFFGDYCNGSVWIASQDESGEWGAELFLNTDFVISSFGEDEQGELYLVDYKGAIYRLEVQK